MPERDVPPDAEFFNELKEVSLEAASQVLGGLALARRVLDAKLSASSAAESQPLSALGDLLFGQTRMHVEQVRTVLRFQRWVTERVVDGILQKGAGPAAPVPAAGAPNSGAPNSGAPNSVTPNSGAQSPAASTAVPGTAHPAGVTASAGAETQRLHGKLGSSVTHWVHFAAGAQLESGYTQVTLSPGVRAYLDWVEAAATEPGGGRPQGLESADKPGQLGVRFLLDAAKLTPGDYSGVTVLEWGGQLRRFPFVVTVQSQ